MVSGLRQSSRLPDYRAKRHGVAVWLAVWGSVVAHAIALQVVPPVVLGRYPDGEMASRRHRPLVLGAVRLDGREVWEERARFRRADRFVDADAVSDDDWQTALREWSERAPLAHPDADLPGDHAALSVPDVEEAAGASVVQADLLRIHERIVPDDVALLPRRIVTVPDPLIEAPHDADERVEARLSGRDAPQWARTGEGGDAADEERTPVTPAFLRAAVRGGIDRVVEPLDTVSSSEPIEHWLEFSWHLYTPPDEQEYRYFRIDIRRSPRADLPVLPRDLILLQDVSASMTQPTLDRSKRGWHHWIRSLHAEDRFTILAFNDSVAALSGTLLPNTARNRSRAAYFIENWRVSGETDLTGVLATVLDVESSEDRPLLVVMTSDGVPTGGDRDSTAIMSAFTARNRGERSVFTIGGGPQINDYLLDYLSYLNRGTSLVTGNRDEIPHSMEVFAAQLSRPVLMDLNYRIRSDPRTVVYPRLLTHLYLDRPLQLYGRIPQQEDRFQLHVMGRSRNARNDMVFDFNVRDALQGDAAIRENWAWHSMVERVGAYVMHRDEQSLDQLQQLVARYGMRVAYGLDFMPEALKQRFRFHGQRTD